MGALGSYRVSLPDYLLSAPCRAQAKTQVVGYRHMRVERIRLKNHGDPSFGRVDLIHELAADMDFALVHLFKTGNNSQQSRFSTARRANQDDEFAIGHI